MTDQTVASLSTQTISREKIYLDPQDQKVIRSLADQVRKLADLPEQEEKLSFPFRGKCILRC